MKKILSVTTLAALCLSLTAQAQITTWDTDASAESTGLNTATPTFIDTSDGQLTNDYISGHLGASALSVGQTLSVSVSFTSNATSQSQFRVGVFASNGEDNPEVGGWDGFLIDGGAGAGSTGSIFTPGTGNVHSSTGRVEYTGTRTASGSWDAGSGFTIAIDVARTGTDDYDVTYALSSDSATTPVNILASVTINDYKAVSAFDRWAITGVSSNWVSPLEITGSSVSVIPEPAAATAILGLLTLSLVFIRRKR